MRLHPFHFLLALGVLVLAACGNASDNGPAASTQLAGAGSAGASGGATPPAATAAVRTAQISGLKNNVDAKKTDATDWLKALEGEQITAGGGVRTGSDSRVKVSISDGTIFRIAANTQFQLADFSPAPSDPVTKLKLDAGKVWVWVTKALGQGTFEVDTPSGVATVRGSLMSVDFDPQTQRLQVTCAEGQCRVDNGQRGVVDLTAGQQTEITRAGQTPGAATGMTRLQVQDWLDNFPEAAVPLKSLLDRLPTPAAASGGQTACDHPYLPMRPGASWTYQSSSGPYTLAITSVSGDANHATAEMTFTSGSVTGTYHWICDASGLISYDFGQISSSALGTLVVFSAASGTGVWLPAAPLLKPGYSWSGSFDLTGTITMPKGAGTGDMKMHGDRTATVTGADPVSYNGKSVDGLEITEESQLQTQITLQGFSAPSQPMSSSTTTKLARGIGMIDRVSTGSGSTDTATLTSYNVP